MMRMEMTGKPWGSRLAMAGAALALAAFPVSVTSHQDPTPLCPNIPHAGCEDEALAPLPQVSLVAELDREVELAALPEPPAFEQTGKASWYGPGFHGRKTASGARFNQYALTAAHRTLPLGTEVKVTNLETGRTIMVRINDRGPYVDGRIIDLSKRAAVELGMEDAGVAPVKVEAIGDQPVEKAVASRKTNDVEVAER